MLRRKIENELNLPKRIVDILRVDGEIKTVGQLLTWDRAELMKRLPGIGNAACERIGKELRAAIARRYDKDGGAFTQAVTRTKSGLIPKRG